MSSNGIQQWDKNFIKIQKYAYINNSKSRVVVVGSSLANNISGYFDADIFTNLAIPGGCSQTGIEAFKRSKLKSSILLVEINGTITRKIDESTIDSIYNPLFYDLRSYFPILRQEYQPVSAGLSTLNSIRHNLEKKTFCCDE